MVTKISNIIDYDMEVLKEFLPDFKRSFHLRLLAEIIGTTHRTVSKSLEKLEKSGIVYHETKGRNKVYYLNLKNSLTKIYLIKAEIYKTLRIFSNNFLIQKIYCEIAVNLKQKPLVLFGSFARKEEKQESDLDLLIIGKEDKVIKKQLKEFGNRHGRKVQIYFIKREEFKRGLKAGDNMILEVVRDHVIMNNHTFFVDILWRYYK